MAPTPVIRLADVQKTPLRSIEPMASGFLPKYWRSTVVSRNAGISARELTTTLM